RRRPGALRLRGALRGAHAGSVRERAAADPPFRQGLRCPLPPDRGGAAGRAAGSPHLGRGRAVSALEPARLTQANTKRRAKRRTMPTTASADLMDKPQARQRDPLLQPFRLKGLTLRNRIMSTSHAATIDEGGLPKERYQRYHEEKAKGGIALTMFGGSSMVARDSS